MVVVEMAAADNLVVIDLAPESFLTWRVDTFEGRVNLGDTSRVAESGPDPRRPPGASLRARFKEVRTCIQLGIELPMTSRVRQGRPPRVACRSDRD
jgi:hypothetical protein